MSAETTTHTKIKPDDTPPQNAIIFASAVLAVLALFGLKYVFDSYMDRSEVRVRAQHIEDSHAVEVLGEYRRHAALELNGGEIPITEAMDQLAERGRGAFVQIRPVADTTTGAREGWARMPVAPPAPHPMAETPTAEPSL